MMRYTMCHTIYPGAHCCDICLYDVFVPHTQPCWYFSHFLCRRVSVLCHSTQPAHSARCECFKSVTQHGKTVNVSGPRAFDNIKRVYQACIWRGTRFSQRIWTLQIIFFAGHQCHIPPRLHFSVTGEGLVTIKSIHYGKCQLIAWHFSSVEAEMSELLNLSVLWVWRSGWRHRCLSQFNSTSSAVMADQRGASSTASWLSRRPADKQPLVSEQASCLCSRRASKLPFCACLCVF